VPALDRLRAAARERRVRLAAAGLVALLLALLGTGWDFETVAPGPRPEASGKPLARDAARLAAERERLQAALRRHVPRGPWIVIDQTHNRLRLMRGDDTVLEAPCSAGSGMILKEASGGRRVWVFDTPRGRFEVLSKAENPVWKKPDWAFVEEGEPIPKDPGERMEYGSLGEYALYFGNGYMIHGTLYERLLGRPVSHGCIRLGKEPLREVYRAAPLGTPVYIY
jgi:L,D-transpeptidase YbiS